MTTYQTLLYFPVQIRLFSMPMFVSVRVVRAKRQKKSTNPRNQAVKEVNHDQHFFWFYPVVSMNLPDSRSLVLVNVVFFDVLEEEHPT